MVRQEAIYKGATRPAMKFGVPLVPLVVLFGGAMLLILWGGLLPPETEVSPANALRRTRLTLVAGSRDQYVTAAALSGERARLDTAGLPYDVIQFEGGHAINRTVFPQLMELSGASGR